MRSRASRSIDLPSRGSFETVAAFSLRMVANGMRLSRPRSGTAWRNKTAYLTDGPDLAAAAIIAAAAPMIVTVKFH